jgi:hypothetical protein
VLTIATSCLRLCCTRATVLLHILSWFGTTDAVTTTTAAAAVPPVLCLHGAFGSGKSLTLCAVCVLIDSLAQAHTAATATAAGTGEDTTGDSAAIASNGSSSTSSSSVYNRYGNSSSCGSDIHQQAAAAAAEAADMHSSSSEMYTSVNSDSSCSSSEVKAVGQWSHGGPRVLLAAATNVAVDGVLLRLIGEGFESIARLGSLRRIANVSHSLFTTAFS